MQFNELEDQIEKTHKKVILDAVKNEVFHNFDRHDPPSLALNDS